MFAVYTFGVLQKLKTYRPNDWHFGSWITYPRNLHSRPDKYRCLAQPSSRVANRKGKKGDKEKADHKVYMREVVREISNILRHNSWISAQDHLQKFHIKWDSFTVNQVLKTHPPMEKAWLFFNWTSKQKGFKHDQFTYTTMLDIFGEAKRINSMKHVFQLMQENGIKIDAITYTSLFHWLSNSGDFEGAVKVWKEMNANGCYPTVVSYTAYMKVLFDNNRAEEATEIYKEMLQAGLKPTCHTYTILMEYLIRSGKCASALEVFRKMQETGVQPDKATCNIMIDHCSQAEAAWAIIDILQYMKKNSLVLRYPIYLQAHKALRMAGETDVLLQQVNPHISVSCFNDIESMESEESISDINHKIDQGLLMEFLRKKNFLAIDHLFTGMAHHNTHLAPGLVSEVIEANCTHGRVEAAILVLKYCNNMGICVEKEVFLSLLGALIRRNEFFQILPIVQQMLKMNLYVEPRLASFLIYRLGQARELDTAVKLLNLFPEEMKTTTLYTAFISACFSSGNPDKAAETFKSMRTRDIQGSPGTYNVLIRGLENCGRFDEAKFYRKEKKSLQRKTGVSETQLLDEKLCDVLFEGYLMA